MSDNPLTAIRAEKALTQQFFNQIGTQLVGAINDNQRNERAKVTLANQSRQLTENIRSSQFNDDLRQRRFELDEEKHELDKKKHEADLKHMEQVHELNRLRLAQETDKRTDLLGRQYFDEAADFEKGAAFQRFIETGDDSFIDDYLKAQGQYTTAVRSGTNVRDAMTEFKSLMDTSLAKSEFIAKDYNPATSVKVREAFGEQAQQLYEQNNNPTVVELRRNRLALGIGGTEPQQIRAAEELQKATPKERIDFESASASWDTWNDEVERLEQEVNRYTDSNGVAKKLPTDGLGLEGDRVAQARVESLRNDLNAAIRERDAIKQAFRFGVSVDEFREAAQQEAAEQASSAFVDPQTGLIAGNSFGPAGASQESLAFNRELQSKENPEEFTQGDTDEEAQARVQLDVVSEQLRDLGTNTEPLNDVDITNLDVQEGTRTSNISRKIGGGGLIRSQSPVRSYVSNMEFITIDPGKISREKVEEIELKARETASKTKSKTIKSHLLADSKFMNEAAQAVGKDIAKAMAERAKDAPNSVVRQIYASLITAIMNKRVNNSIGYDPIRPELGDIVQK